LLCPLLRASSLRLPHLPSPPPARRPLFPYTTLFRSRAMPLQIPRGGYWHFFGPQSGRWNLDDGLFSMLRLATRFGNARRIQENADRKSTRLNSSHVKISYAVFCLKKKKTTTKYRSKL